MTKELNEKWWKESVVYQIYPRSFYDSCGDGVGDLRGIIEKLDYLDFLGIKAIWLNPIYQSPNADMGYDISDYQDISEEFGTLKDFDELVEKIHEKGMRLIMDLVVNHSSDEHKWFVESKKSKDNPFRDYYIWRDGKDDKEPNNWSSFFEPSAWTFDDATGQWYLHLFATKQPDLNWENEKLRGDVFAMMNWWFKKGVDGFRMDVINLIAKKEGLPGGEMEKPNPQGYVFSHEHFASQEKLHEYLKEMYDNCFAGTQRMCVGETPFMTVEKAQRLLSEEEKQLDLLFAFDLMDIDTGEGGKWNIVPYDMEKFKNIIDKWQNGIEWNSLFWSNHDQPRPVTRFGSCESEEMRVKSAKMLAVLMIMLKGTYFLYQGEELGMTNYPFENVGQLKDVESINFYDNATDKEWAFGSIQKKGRDNARTPMQWDESTHGGFTKGEPWLSVNPNYSYINVEKETADENSVLHFYKKLIQLKQNDKTLIYGDYTPLFQDDDEIFAYERTLGGDKFVVICNFSKEKIIRESLNDFAGFEVILTNTSNSSLPTTLEKFDCYLLRKP